MKDILKKIARAAAEVNKPAPEDYIKDGLLYCGACHTPKQTRVPLLGKEQLVYCLCQCQSEAYAQEQAALADARARLEADNLRRQGLRDPVLWTYTFEKDNGSSPKLIDIAKKYVASWEKMQAKNVGLCFLGGVGTGKTYAAACIANYLIDRGVRVVFTSFSRIINDIQSFDTHNKNAYLDSVCSCGLLIIDDLGAERQSDYALSICMQVVDQRLQQGKPLVLTTNVSMGELKNPNDIKYARLYSRILDVTVFAQSQGGDKRLKTHEENMAWARAYFSD